MILERCCACDGNILRSIELFILSGINERFRTLAVGDNRDGSAAVETRIRHCPVDRSAVFAGKLCDLIEGNIRNLGLQFHHQTGVADIRFRTRRERLGQVLCVDRERIRRPVQAACERQNRIGRKIGVVDGKSDVSGCRHIRFGTGLDLVRRLGFEACFS